MRALKEYTSRNEELQKFAESVTDFPLTQAVHVEPHPWLLKAWIAYRRRPWAEFSFDIRSGTIGPVLIVKDPNGLMDEIPLSDLPIGTHTDPEFDYERRPGFFDQISLRKTPLLVRVHLCANRVDPTGEFPEKVADQRRAIAETAENFLSYFDIVLEDRPLARLAPTPGSRVNAATLGTIGGILINPNGSALYGITCAHVAPAGWSVTDSAGNVLGKSAQTSLLTPNTAGQLCRPGASGMNEIDAALFSVPSGTASASGTVPSMQYGSGQHVEMTGAKSGGPHPYYVGSLGLVHTIDLDGTDYCFNDLFSVRPMSTLPLSGRAATMFTHRALRGDSGAWIVSVSQSEWYGMLIAVDGTEGFAVDATANLTWAKNTLQASTLHVY